MLDRNFNRIQLLSAFTKKENRDIIWITMKRLNTKWYVFTLLFTLFSRYPLSTKSNFVSILQTRRWIFLAEQGYIAFHVINSSAYLLFSSDLVCYWVTRSELYLLSLMLLFCGCCFYYLLHQFNIKTNKSIYHTNSLLSPKASPSVQIFENKSVLLICRLVVVHAFSCMRLCVEWLPHLQNAVIPVLQLKGCFENGELEKDGRHLMW